MSNLNSVFDTLRGWPDGSALESSFKPKKGATLVEGTVVAGESVQLADASVFRIVDDTLVTAPTLTSADAGLAYGVAGVGGAWSTFAVGDIVEWDGSAWVKIVDAVEAEFATGTRAVVAPASAATAAGSFAGHAGKVAQYTKHTVELTCAAGGYVNCVVGDIGKPVTSTGSGDSGHLVSYDNVTRKWIVDPDTPADVFQAADVLAITGGTGAGTVDTGGVAPLGGAWAFTTPDDGARIYITSGVFAGNFYDYTTSWRKARSQERAPVVMAAYSSVGWDGNRKGDTWLVIQGNDQYDAAFVNKITCLKLKSGCTFQVQNDAANTLVAGTLVQAAAGAIQAFTDKWPIGVVVWSNGVSGSGGKIAIASM